VRVRGAVSSIPHPDLPVLIFAAFQSTNHPDTATTNLTDSLSCLLTPSTPFSRKLRHFGVAR